jgi:hypothetical protein
MLDKIDRRFIFLFVAISLSLPILIGISLKPARMKTSQAFYDVVQALSPSSFVLVAVDWDPGTRAENEPQTLVLIEHLFRRNIKFGLISLTPLAAPNLEQLPLKIKKRLELENIKLAYGKDWVNLGYRPGAMVMVQNLAKAKDLKELLKTDAKGTPLSELSAFAQINSIKDIGALAEFTGSVGALGVWLQFFSGPALLHGCTSITIPDAFNYFASGQLKGLFEGVAGAAHYELLLQENYPKRSKDADVAIPINSGVSFAQLGVFAFIFLGNLGLLRSMFSK